MRQLIAARHQWLTVVQLPAYAPDLNPVEGLWSTMKSSLDNLAVTGVDHLTAIIRQPTQAHPVPTRPDPRLPHPDRTHPGPGTPMTETDPRLSTAVTGHSLWAHRTFEQIVEHVQSTGTLFEHVQGDRFC
ncbi:transposase [Micromonosporaceae bacterium B7E4]